MQVREAAEKAALKKAAEEVGERLDDEPSGLDDDEGDTGDAYYDDEDDGGIIVLARFKVNKHDVVSVFKATTKEDFKDVVKLLPENTPLPASNKMTYLIARLELNPAADIEGRIALVNAGRASMGEAVGPAVGCLMATFGTNMISSCIFDFDDPDELEEFAVEERIELWGLQVRLPTCWYTMRDTVALRTLATRAGHVCEHFWEPSGGSSSHENGSKASDRRIPAHGNFRVPW
jgi:hypothetical protein